MWNKIVNPLTGKKVSINSKAGLNILSKYLKQYSQNHIGGAEEKDQFVEIDDKFILSDYVDDSNDGDDAEESINIMVLDIEQNIQRHKEFLELLKDEKEKVVRDCSLDLDQRIIEQEKIIKEQEKYKEKTISDYLNRDLKKIIEGRYMLTPEKIKQRKALLDKQQNKKIPIKNQKNLDDYLKKQSNKY